jgi:hypothetical protein
VLDTSLPALELMLDAQDQIDAEHLLEHHDALRAAFNDGNEFRQQLINIIEGTDEQPASSEDLSSIFGAIGARVTRR